MDAKKDKGVLKITVSPDEVVDAVKSFVWYRTWANAPKLVEGENFVFGACVFRDGLFHVEFVQKKEVPK